MEYKLRKTEKKDAEKVWEIRNHDLIRKNSSNSGLISLEDHKKWFLNKYFNKQKNFCYILEDESKMIGYCRLDYDLEEKAYVVSIAVNPEKHGKGLGNFLLSGSLEKLCDDSENIFLAQVKRNNIPSAKLFERNGFKKYKEDEENYYYRKLNCKFDEK